MKKILMNGQKIKKIFNYTLIGIGVLSIIFAILCFVLNGEFGSTYSVGRQRYGGDAYTGIQNAAAATASNIDALNESVETLANCIKIGFGFVLLIGGLLIILLGTKELMQEKKNEVQLVSNVVEVN
ncbi:MAG: hypothetical protein IJ393_04335 [Clostridia bacterium]|nr:hypothetical protein [Clostridia bacterium]